MKLLTYEELSKELSLSIRYLQKCVKNGSLRCVRFGRAIRFDPADVAEWVNNQKEDEEIEDYSFPA
jgi:excisionase family DNA binding protein